MSENEIQVWSIARLLLNHPNTLCKVSLVAYKYQFADTLRIRMARIYCFPFLVVENNMQLRTLGNLSSNDFIGPAIVKWIQLLAYYVKATRCGTKDPNNGVIYFSHDMLAL